MKIGLIDPGSKKIILNENFPHLGLAYIAACLEDEGHKVKILDVSLAGDKETENFLREEHELIGFSATSFTLGPALKIAEKAKTINNDIITVLGGPHISIGMETVLEFPHIDYAVYGEGESTMCELVEQLQKNGKPGRGDLAAINGLIFRDKGGVVVNSQRPRIDNLDKLPFPAFHLLPMDKYGLYPLLTSRGCPFGCTFCSIKAIWGTLWKHRSPESIVHEIDIARKRYNWENKPFSIIDDSFNVNPDRVMNFCDLIIDRNINIQWFSAGFRADRVSLPLALKMKEAGCIGVSIGIESANNGVLHKIKKKETIEEISKSCRNLAEAEIPILAQFMIGNPGDTLETVKESIKFAKKHNFSNAAFYLTLPYPKTELWDYVKENGRFLKEDYTQFHHFSNEPVFETPEFPAAERTKAYAMARRYSVQTKIKEEIRTKLGRIRRLDFQDLSLKKVVKAATRMIKYCLDLTLGRKEQV